MSSSKSNKKESRNIRALFSVICLCIISLGLIVYFSTNNKTDDNTVNEPTTIVETTEVQRAVTIKETTKAQSQTQTTVKATTTTEPATMEQSKTNTPYKSYYKYPLTEAVSKGYSEELTLNKTMGDYRVHTAVDFTGSEGDKVVAVNDGLVTKVYNDTMLGTVVEIDHGGKLVAKYCGLKSVNVKEGSYVDIGNTIGTLGTVPYESEEGAHLHFAVAVDGRTVNPLDAMCKTE